MLDVIFLFETLFGRALMYIKKNHQWHKLVLPLLTDLNAYEFKYIPHVTTCIEYSTTHDYLITFLTVGVLT